MPKITPSFLSSREALAVLCASCLLLFGLPRAIAADGHSGRVLLETFDYEGVVLRDSRWRTQMLSARDYYLSVSDDDILHGYRQAAGLPAPGQTLGGWCAKNSDTVFGQWLSGMSRLYKATGDERLRAKAAGLLREWKKTVGADGDCRMDLYSFDKLVCGLVDLHRYASDPEAVPTLRETLGWAMRTFSRVREDETPENTSGEPGEWYTFAENLYRAWDILGGDELRAFADSYLHPRYWGRFEATSSPVDAHHVHAYSHVNSFSSVAMAYRETGDRRWLNILRNAYDYLQATQCYATGGYGPMERIVPPDGTLGRSLEARNASFETVCGSWAGFKMCRYLTEFTGEARYGDWAERLFYNGIGAALPITAGGKHFYYSDYRMTGGMKVYKVSRYSCCSGSFLLCVADYHNLIYYHTADTLYVNLYLPSEVVWNGPGGKVRLVQDTAYPEAETVGLRVSVGVRSTFALAFRIPGWAEGVTVSVCGKEWPLSAKAGGWGEIRREWSDGDAVEIRIPLRLREVPVDAQHPRRVAVVRGPAVLVRDDWVFEDIVPLPGSGHLESWLVPDERQPGVFRINAGGKRPLEARFRPFYAIGEATPYRIYHDLDAQTIPVW